MGVEGVLSRLDLIDLILSTVVAIGIYGTVDGFSRLGKITGEYGRKAIHVSIGIFAASFPIYMNRTEIFVFHGLFFVGLVGLSLLSEIVRTKQRFQKFWIGRMLVEIFERYEDVNRWTIGQFLFPLSLMLVVLIYDNLLIYSFAVLFLALSDGFAAVIGKGFGHRKYYVPGGYKTYIGSLTFFLISLTLFCVYLFLETDATYFALLPAFIYATFLTLVEGSLAGGFDNLAVPLIAAVLLNTIS